MDKAQLEALLDEADKLRSGTDWTTEDEASYKGLINLYVSLSNKPEPADTKSSTTEYSLAPKNAGENRYSFGSGQEGLGSGKYLGQQAPVVPGQELNALDAIANANDAYSGGGSGNYDYNEKADLAHRKYQKALDDAWDALPQEERDEIYEKSNTSTFGSGFLEGVAPISTNWFRGLEGQAKQRALKQLNPDAYGYGELAGLGAGIVGGGVGTGKAVKTAADIALSSPKAGLRKSSKLLNDKANEYRELATGKREGTDQMKSLQEVLGKSADEVADQFDLMADKLQAFDRKIVDGNRRFGVKNNRKNLVEDLEARGLAQRETGNIDIIRQALGPQADDVYNNAIKGNVQSRGQIVNVWQQYAAEPISSNARAALTNLPSTAISAISGIAGGAMTGFIYAFEYFYDQDYSATEAAAAALEYVKEFGVEDLNPVGNAVGVAQDLLTGTLSKNQGGLLGVPTSKSMKQPNLLNM